MASTMTSWRARAPMGVSWSPRTPTSASAVQAGAALPSLILFRLGNRAPEHQVATLLGDLEQVAEDLDEGAIVVFTNDNIRIRRLPTRTDAPTSRRRAAR